MSGQFWEICLEARDWFSSNQFCFSVTVINHQVSQVYQFPLQTLKHRELFVLDLDLEQYLFDQEHDQINIVDYDLPSWVALNTTSNRLSGRAQMEEGANQVIVLRCSDSFNIHPINVTINLTLYNDTYGRMPSGAEYNNTPPALK